MQRCKWAQASEIEMHYHDNEWGVPCFDDRLLFEQLNLEGQQAGLSWKTILMKREAYREAFHQFNPDKIDTMSKDDVDKLLLNPGIVRYRLKIEAIIKNARAYKNLTESQSFSDFIWSFVNNEPIVNSIHEDMAPVTPTDVANSLSKALKKHGFSFVGPTTVYAFMQAVGMVNDHEDSCFRKRLVNE